jgi:hypothetical protein
MSTGFITILDGLVQRDLFLGQGGVWWDESGVEFQATREYYKSLIDDSGENSTFDNDLSDH